MPGDPGKLLRLRQQFANFILKRRVEKRLTEKEVADTVGLSPQGLSRIEAGISLPGPTILKRLMDCLEISRSEMSVFRQIPAFQEVLDK